MSERMLSRTKHRAHASKRVQLVAFAVTITLMGMIATGCADEESEQNREATATALVRSIVMTATADASGEESPQEALATAEAQATEAARAVEEGAIAATGTAAAAQVEQPPSPVPPTATPEPPKPEASEEITGTVSAKEEAVRQELPAYGIDPSTGSLAWVHPPARLEVTGFQQFSAVNEFAGPVAGDFVLAADITWNTEFGDAACGYALRSTGFEEESSQYLAMLTRRDSGRAVFQSRENGIFNESDRFDVAASDFDPNFQFQNDTTNRFVVVAQGGVFTLFTNGAVIGQVTPQLLLDQGVVAFVTLSDSGTTICQFTNAWLWLLE